MLTQAQQVFQIARDAHGDAYGNVHQLAEQLPTMSSQGELADTALAMREAARYFKDALKEVEKIRELAERLACLLWLKDAVGDPIHTDHVSATPQVKTMASVPKRSTQPEQHAALMQWLGVPDHLWAADGPEVVRVHWPSFVELLTTNAEQGKPLPDGIDPDKTYPRYSLTMRRKKDVDE